MNKDLKAAQWRKSSLSGTNGGNCVEVATNLPGIVAVRDSKNPDGLVFAVSEGAFGALISSIKEGKI